MVITVAMLLCCSASRPAIAVSQTLRVSTMMAPQTPKRRGNGGTVLQSNHAHVRTPSCACLCRRRTNTHTNARDRRTNTFRRYA
uniref:Putative secreted protein n=1 Tax=Anopheles darlingi TaxID=43151 RepID=A0A2M4D5U2_ANODA